MALPSGGWRSCLAGTVLLVPLALFQSFTSPSASRLLLVPLFVTFSLRGLRCVGLSIDIPLIIHRYPVSSDRRHLSVFHASFVYIA